jgi:hypothetical protein
LHRNRRTPRSTRSEARSLGAVTLEEKVFFNEPREFGSQSDEPRGLLKDRKLTISFAQKSKNPEGRIVATIRTEGL